MLQKAMNTKPYERTNNFQGYFENSLQYFDKNSSCYSCKIVHKLYFKFKFNFKLLFQKSIQIQAAHKRYRFFFFFSFLNSFIYLLVCQLFCCERAWMLTDFLLRGAVAEETSEQTMTDRYPVVQKDQRLGSVLSVIAFHHLTVLKLNSSLLNLS